MADNRCYQLMDGSWGSREDWDRENLAVFKETHEYKQLFSKGYIHEDGSYASFDEYAEINLQDVRAAVARRDRFAIIHFTWGPHGYDGRVDKRMREILYEWMVDTLPDWTYTLHSDRWVPRALLPEEAAVLQKMANDRHMIWAATVLENHAEGLSQYNGGQKTAVNYVVTFDIGVKKPTHVVINANPLKFGNDLQGVSFNLAYPQVKISMYPSGRGLLVGARNVMQILYAIKWFMLELKKCGVVNAYAENMRVRNITATVKMSTGMFDIAQFSEDHSKTDSGKVFFDLSFFPGMRVRFKNLPLCCTMFATSKMNLTGSNKTSDIEAAFECFEQEKSKYVLRKHQIPEFEARMKRIKTEHRANKRDRKETKREFLALANELPEEAEEEDV